MNKPLLIVVAGPPDSPYKGPEHTPGEIARPFPMADWVSSGLSLAILKAAGPWGHREMKGYSSTRSYKVWRQLSGIQLVLPITFLLPPAFPLACEVRQFFETHAGAGCFQASLSYWEGVVQDPDAVGLYLDPVGAACPSQFVSHGIEVANNNWIYWPQQYYWRKTNP